MARILIADEDADERDLIVFALRFASHKVLRLTSQQGFLQARDYRPDLVILDASLLLADGKSEWSEIKSDPDLAKIPLIVLVDPGQEPAVESMLDSARLHLLPRPFSLDRLTKKVNHSVKKARK